MNNLTFRPLSSWSGVDRRPLIIAGPQVMESRDHIFETAKRLSGSGTHYLSAGIWQAPAGPENSVGLGGTALPWLKEAGRQYQLRTAADVATARQVESALRHNIDLLWIDGRVTSHPQMIQEIANALRGSSVPVLLQNPPSRNIQVWLGAIERIANAGVRSIGAIQRGIAVGGTASHGHSPMWDIVLELRRLLPTLTIISDPCLISNAREQIPAVSQRAIDLGVDGLMYGVHPSPDHSWSGEGCQITPERMGEIVAELHVRNQDADDAAFTATIEALREQIDHVDINLLAVLAERMKIVTLIADKKRANNVTALQPVRWQALLSDRMERARLLGLDPIYAKAIYDVIHAESVRRQSLLMSEATLGDGSRLDSG